MKIRFWGVRGSRPVPGFTTLRYGGNTPCVEVRTDKRIFIFDAGTGICELAKDIIKKQVTEAEIYVTHTHWDHIHGFPFFTPAFIPGNKFTLHGPAQCKMAFSEIMRSQMAPPFFPLTMDAFSADISVRELNDNETVSYPEGCHVKTCKTNHPDGCLAYRLEYQKKSICYITDTEHYAKIDTSLKAFCSEADLMIYDASYTDSEYTGENGSAGNAGWGHSTWQEAIKLAKASHTKKLVLFHHAPFRSDEQLDAINIAAQSQFPACITAMEGMEIEI